MPKPKPKPIGRVRLVSDLVPDAMNRRTHPARNVEMIATALREVGAARSIVIDEANAVLAGNGVLLGAKGAGLTKVQVVDAPGDTIVAVRRRGLTEDQKRQLAIYDNRTAELAEWNAEILGADLRDGLDLGAFFSDDELLALFPDEAPAAARATLADRFGVPPFSILDARQGYWQDRKRAWLALGIESELGRGADIVPNGTTRPPEQDGAYRRTGRKPTAYPGGGAMPGVRGPRKGYTPGKAARLRVLKGGAGRAPDLTFGTDAALGTDLHGYRHKKRQAAAKGGAGLTYGPEAVYAKRAKQKAAKRARAAEGDGTA